MNACMHELALQHMDALLCWCHALHNVLVACCPVSVLHACMIQPLACMYDHTAYLPQLHNVLHTLFFGVFMFIALQGLDAHVAERLALWRFDNKRVALRYDGVPPADQPAALRRTLRQLADMQAPEATVWLQGWQWPAVADTVAECLPLLPHLQFGVHTDKPLTDQLLAVVLRMGPHMRCLYVYRLALQSDHSGVAWPWSVLSVEHLDIAQMLRLPQPGPGAQLRTCVFRLKHEAVRAHTHTRTHTHTHTFRQCNATLTDTRGKCQFWQVDARVCGFGNSVHPRVPTGFVA